ncbi:nuclear transport factor 2 family protein [Massilia arenae]|uniref:nuclear transport factor 2 family protein n=1 Tax=Massilia arenae TaxID=2603288 RepID=UPI00164F0C84|nr:nuclear transport factor 2 family protein [Massilia arenae]
MINLPSAISTYVEATNAQDAQRVAAAFLPDATVHDEGHLRRGRADIAAWAEDTARQYGSTMVPIGLDRIDGKDDGYALRAEVSGNFPGSPITLAFHFALQSNSIASLEIKP